MWITCKHGDLSTVKGAIMNPQFAWARGALTRRASHGKLYLTCSGVTKVAIAEIH